MLFKGGTSLSKGFGLIARFSEDIDITVFREDIGEPASVEELEALSGKKRQVHLDAIRTACQQFIQGPLREEMTGLIRAASLFRKGIAENEIAEDFPALSARDLAYARLFSRFAERPGRPRKRLALRRGLSA